MRAAYQLLLKHPHVHMVNNSHYGARAYETWLGLKKGRIRVIPNAFPFDQEILKKAEQARSHTREEYGIPVNAQVIGAVMRLSEEKQPLLWLQIAYFLHQRAPDLQFLLIGDGPLRSTVENEIDQLGLSQAFHRMSETKDSLAAIAAMDLMLFTPRAEGLANCLIEAQALGVPIVSSAFGGETEAMLIDQTGWIIEANNPKASADRILEILRSEQHLSRVKHLGPQFVKENFGVMQGYQQYTALYSDE
jgi:glycosyltransferase involved in cell wall biosynthesis